MSMSKLIGNSEFPASLKTIPKCSICSSNFSTFPTARNRPLILSCYHDICERCVYTNRQQTEIICRKCDTKTLYKKLIPFRQIFEFNYYINGFLYYKEHLLNIDISRSNYENNNQQLSSLQKRHECNECNREYTQHFCIQCRVPYCLPCFKRLHSHGKAFQKHHLSLLERENNIIFNNNKNEHNKCHQHKQVLNKYCQTCKEIICSKCCTSSNHHNHIITSLQNENRKYLSQINSLIETVKMAIDTNRQALKDTKSLENKYEQYGDDAIEFITSYFNKLHNILQITESKILIKIKETSIHSVGKVKKTQNTLEKSLKNLDELVVSLQKIVDDRPNYPILHIIEKTNNLLETIPCQVKFDNYEKTPFLITKTKMIENDLENSVHLTCDNSAQIHINLLTFFGDVSLHLNEYDTNNIDNTKNIDTNEISDINTSPQDKLMLSIQYDKKPKKLIKKRKNKNGSENNNNDRLTNSLDNWETKKPIKILTNSQTIYTKRVHVSHIKNPQEFYVQNEVFRLTWDKFLETCKTEAEIAITPDYIELNNIYLIFSNNSWYRGKVIKINKMNTFKVFLIDFGITLQIVKQCIRQISDVLENRPNEAIKCSLFGIKAKIGNFTDEANCLMTDIIAKNQFIDMIILKEDNPCIVDLIVSENFPTSISDALIFTDVFDKDDTSINDKELNRNLRVYNEMKKKLIPPITKSFYKTVLSEKINDRIIPLNIINPKEFYVTKYDFISDIEQISNDLNQTYYTNNNKIFLPRPNMPCAVCIKGKWFRGRILQVDSKVKCKIWLIDYGISEIVLWKQLRILDEKYLKNSEYSFECSLIDIEALQLNNYSWTNDAITEFKHCMKQRNLQIFVHKTKDFCHKVTLFIVKKTVDINVNALMVKYGFAISTGSESLIVENTKLNNQNDQLSLNQNLLLKIDIKSEDDDISLPVNQPNKITNINDNNNNNNKLHQFRTKICITAIKSPGEFYIHLEKHLNAIKKLQKDIQISQNKKISNNNIQQNTIKSNNNWKINDNCLVYTKLCNDKNNKLQWYRGIITNIDHHINKYQIFLRDYGQQIDNIIFDDIEIIDEPINRICNTALKCHLACVHPTGGIENWSHSSIDQLKDIIRKFDTISANIQGEKKNNSIPVILWGMTNEYSDALAPNICKWLNINRILVNNGLAHLYEKFENGGGKQDFEYLNKEFEETEKQIKELWINVVDDISKVVENQKINNNNPQNIIMEDSIFVDFSDDDSDDIESVISWIPAKPIKKSIFTAIPTFIDDNGYIYLHDAQSKCVLDKIKKIINEKISNYDKIRLPENIRWYIGQPCIARYHLDNLYYRGEIINIKSNDIIQVCFVDYGNIEDCNTNDLIKDLCLTKVPIQATKYELDDIVPNTDNGIWPREVLDFMHSIIVMKMCSIRISDMTINNIIKKCSIRCESNSIIDLLLENNYAIKKSQVFDKLLQSESCKVLKKAIIKTNIIRQFLSSSDDDDNIQDNSDNEKDILIRATKPINNIENENIEEYRKDSDYYKKLFEKKELENLYTSIMSGKEISDEIALEMDCTYHSENWQKNIDNFELSPNNEAEIKLMTNNNDKKLCNNNNENYDKDEAASIISFNPKDTSTVISRFDGIDNFTRCELPYGANHFYCEVNYIRDATSLYIHPLLTELEKVFIDMSRRIQIYAKKALPVLEILPKIPCLAKYKEDNLWYRAIIKTVHPNMDKVDVIYVDYLNSDTIPITKLRTCPQQILTYPLRVLEIRLYGLKPNPRWRNSDIMRRLSLALLTNRKIFVEVIKCGKIPVIKLVESQCNRNLVLQELINDRLFILESEK